MEFVYVVPRADLFRDCYPQGFVPFGAPEDCARFLAPLADHGFFVERRHAERSPSLKQIIPYTVVLVSGEVLLLTRKKAGGERRLHDKLSIGVGGHLEPVDAAACPDTRVAGTGHPIVDAGSARELREELDVEGAADLRAVGLLNDDSNAVGAVHVGLVQVLTVDGSVQVREREALDGRFASPAELCALRRQGANFESWSAMLVDALDSIAARSLTAIT
jgi:predicted NUDIX family phosphoesterase